LVAGLAGLELLYLFSGSESGIARAAHVGGMLAGYVYLKWGDRSPIERFAKRWRRRKLKLINGDAPRVPGSRRVETEIDRILDKISEHGLESLTNEEARILDEASRGNKRE
jgi:hypothetical protein